MGKLSFKKKDEKKKKNKKKLTYEKLRKEDKKLKKKCICNHRSAENGKQYFIKKTRGEGPDAIRVLECEICKGELIADESLTNPAAVRQAAEIIYTASSILRKEFKMNDKEYNKLVSAVYMNAKMCDLYEEYYEDLHTNKKDKKKKKNKKNKAVKFNRISY